VKPHLPIPERVDALEAAEERTAKRLAAIERTVAVLVDAALPPAIRALTEELGELLGQVREAREKLKSDRAEHEAKVQRDREKIARLTLEKLEG
jgi:hypothetical protein